jgi:hypothetical protein
MRKQSKTEAKQTDLFRRLLREESPAIEDVELMQWRWSKGGPLFKLQTIPHDHPGVIWQNAAEKMRHWIREGRLGNGPLACVLPIRWRQASVA